MNQLLIYKIWKINSFISIKLKVRILKLNPSRTLLKKKFFLSFYKKFHNFCNLSFFFLKKIFLYEKFMYQLNSERVSIKKILSTHFDTCGIAENYWWYQKKRNFARYIKALDRHHLSQNILVALDEFLKVIQASLMPFPIDWRKSQRAAAIRRNHWIFCLIFN